VPELWTLDHTERVKIRPTNTQGWLSLASVPFKTYTIVAALIYHFYRPLMPGRPGVIGGAALTDWMTGLSLGYFASFVFLLSVAFRQKSSGDRWGALLSFVFAIVAICGGVLLYPPYLK
jgi:hypothetical protein